MSFTKIGCLVLSILILNTVSVSAISIVPKDENSFTCFDYSTDFAKHNPDWGCVTISDHKFFYGSSHMVNYQVYENGSLNIHDGMWGMNYTLENWQNGTRYYHFWLNGVTPVRTYRYLWDNRNELNKTIGGN